MNLTQVAQSAARAGFTGDALATIVAIVQRESGANPAAQGDIALQDGEWGPSVGLYQIRTLKADTGTGSDRDLQALIPGAVAGIPGTGSPDVDRQSRAAFAISGGGSNFHPWSTYAGLSDSDLAAANRAITDAGTLPAATAQTVGIISDVAGGLAGAMDSALGSFLGLPDGETVSEWLAELAIRGLELVGGAVMFACGALVIIDIVGRPSGSDVTGPIKRGIIAGKKLAESAAATAAMA